MYNAYFGFHENPFSVTPNPHFFYANSYYEEAYATLLYAIRERKGLVVLSGEVGTGKTTVLRKLMDSLLDEPVRFVFFYNTTLTFEEMLTFMCDELGLEVKSDQRLQQIQALNAFLISQLQQGGTAVLLIDEAQNLADEVLENLRLLLNLETENEKLLQIVLVGQPELEAKLAQPSLRQLKQRIALRSRLHQLKEWEVWPFIRCRLQAVGCKREDLFTPDALRLIARYSQGTPRLINIICDNALLIAYGTSQKTVSATLIEEVANDLRLKSEEQTVAVSLPVSEVTKVVPDLVPLAIQQEQNTYVPVSSNPVPVTLPTSRESEQSNTPPVRAERVNLAWAIVFFVVLSGAAWGIASFPFPERERFASVLPRTIIPTTENAPSEQLSPALSVVDSAIQEQKPSQSLPLPPTPVLSSIAVQSDLRNPTAADTGNQWQIVSSPLLVAGPKPQVQSPKSESQKIADPDFRTPNTESLTTPHSRSPVSASPPIVRDQDPTNRIPAVKPMSREEIIALLRPPQSKPANSKIVPPPAAPLVSIPAKGKTREGETLSSPASPKRILEEAKEEAKTEKIEELLAEKPKIQESQVALPLSQSVSAPISAEAQGESVTVPDGFTVYSLAKKVYEAPNAILGIDLLNESNPGVGDMNRRVAGAKLWVPPLDQSTLLRQQADGSYHLILASFRSMEDAEDYAHFVINARGYETIVTPREVSNSHLLYRVAIIGLSSVEQAQQVWKVFNPDSSLARARTTRNKAAITEEVPPVLEVDSPTSGTLEEQLPEEKNPSPVEDQEAISPEL